MAEQTTLSSVAIRKSEIKILRGIGCLGAFIAIAVWYLRSGAAQADGEGAGVISWVSIVIFGAGLLHHVHQLIFGDRYPVELSAYGFVDKRSIKQDVPWSAVSRISVLRHRWYDLGLVVHLTGGVAHNTFWLSPIARFWSRFGKPSNPDRVNVIATGLKIHPSELRALFEKHLSDYNSSRDLLADEEA